MKNKKAFTLIELLAVLVILGVILLIAIPEVNKYIDTSKKNSYLETIKFYKKDLATKISGNHIAKDVHDKNKLFMFSMKCLAKTMQNSKDSQYGKWDKSYIGVHFDGKDYNYFVHSHDTSGLGINFKNINEIKKEDITNNNGYNNEKVDNNLGIEIEKDDCTGYEVVSNFVPTEESCFTTYAHNSTEVSLYGYKNTCSKNVVIPRTIGGKTVTKIADAFKNKGLTSVVIPDTVQEIGYAAFMNNQIENLVIPNSITKILMYAFDSAGIKNLTLPNNLKVIADHSFQNNPIKNLVIPDSVEKIEAFAFYNTKIESIKFSNNLKEIEERAFAKINLSKDYVVVFPESTRILTNVFGYAEYKTPKGIVLNKGITKVRLGYQQGDFMDLSVPFIAPNYKINYYDGDVNTLIFQENGGINVDFRSDAIKKINKVVFEEGITTINNSRFQGRHIKEIVIPQSMQDMPSRSFKINPEITKVKLPEKFRNHEYNNKLSDGWWDSSLNLDTIIEYY